MRNRLPVNMVLFSVVVLVIGLSSFFVEVQEKDPSGKPWHMQMNEHGDNLSETYLHQYMLMDHGRAISQLDSFAGTTVLVLIDAWGVPHKEENLAKELSVFDGLVHQFYLHKRLMNYTRFAEQAEFRNTVKESIYLFNGDSTEYGRFRYVPELGFNKIFFLEKCNDVCAISKIDSLLEASQLSKLVALSLQCSREGNTSVLQHSLKLIAKLSKKYPKVRFVVQGTHRPVLVPREEREKYYAYWVPLVVLN